MIIKYFSNGACFNPFGKAFELQQEFVFVQCYLKKTKVLYVIWLAMMSGSQKLSSTVFVYRLDI